MTKTLMTRALVAAATALTAFAQVPAPGTSPVRDYPYQVAYAAALSAGDSVINITNTGATGAGLVAGTAATTAGSICVNAYAFSPDEQMISCCSCPVTPNGLRALSVRRDLTSNTLTPAVPTSIVVKLVASYPTAAGSCANSAATLRGVPVGAAANGEPVTSIAGLPMGMAAWMTTTHNNLVGPGAQATEFPFVPATLSTAGAGANIGELERLRQLCNFILANGSGFGICGSCTLGGLGGGRQ
jgi:hypothetical protein